MDAFYRIQQDIVVLPSETGCRLVAQRCANRPGCFEISNL